MGDSVIGLFPAGFDKKKACINALNCAQGILSIISQCINPVLEENHLPVKSKSRAGLWVFVSNVVRQERGDSSY